MVLPFFNFNVSGQHSEDKKQRQTGRIPYFFITAFLLYPKMRVADFLMPCKPKRISRVDILPQSQIQTCSRIRMTYSWAGGQSFPVPDLHAISPNAMRLVASS